MEIPLHQFEQHIGETTLKRGRAYFKNRQVENPENVGPNKFEITVKGSKDYLIRFTLKDHALTYYKKKQDQTRFTTTTAW